LKGYKALTLISQKLIFSIRSIPKRRRFENSFIIPNEEDLKTLLSGACNVNKTCDKEVKQRYGEYPFTFIGFDEKTPKTIYAGVWSMETIVVSGMYLFG